MKEKIRKQIQVSSLEEGTFTATFSFPATFSGFDGHFPGQPVLPGVCLIQVVLVAVEKALERKPELAGIVLAKFVAVTRPDETLTAVCKVDETLIRAKISHGEERVAEVRLRVNYA